MDLSIKQNLTPKKGDMLLSDPLLPDPNFERTVILLCEHNQEGSFGFVLNKPSSLTVQNVIEEAEQLNQTIFIGGPVQQDTLHFLHCEGDIIEESIKINDNLYWGGNLEQILSLLNTKQIDPKNFKFFLGYAGWEKNQLQEELKNNSWVIYPYKSEFSIFDTDSESLWKKILKNMGGLYKVLANYPKDPRLN